jgi:hypothetical protein
MAEEVKVQEQSTNSRKERRAKKNDAFATLKKIAEETKNAPMIEALKVVRPSLYGIAVGGARGTNPLYAKFAQAVKTAGKAGLHEDQVFKQFKIGRKEANGLIKKQLQKTEPAQRMWIKFNAEAGTYVLAAEGANAPENWEGFKPVNEKVELVR